MKTRLLAFSFAASLVLAGCGDDQLAVQNPPAPPPAPSTAFVDPTATLLGRVELGNEVYVAPFARLDGDVRVGTGSNVQDNVSVSGQVTVGDKAILAHGASIVGPARIGATGGLPCFVGFNALVEGAVVEPDAMVGIRSRVGPGVTLRSGFKTRPGRNITTQAEADQIALGKVEAVNNDDRRFMEGVLEVNLDLNQGYRRMPIDEVRGIGRDPITRLHPQQLIPQLAGLPVLDPTFRNRIIGDVRMADSLAALSAKMGIRDSLRADEGGPFTFGILGAMSDEVTVHALEHSQISVGNNLRIGMHAVLHGGEDVNSVPAQITRVGNNVQIGTRAVVFRSTVGDTCLVGEGALVDRCNLPIGTVVAPNTILIGNQNVGTVEW